MALQEATGLKRVLIVDWDVHHGNGTQVHAEPQQQRTIRLATHVCYTSNFLWSLDTSPTPVDRRHNTRTTQQRPIIRLWFTPLTHVAALVTCPVGRQNAFEDDPSILYFSQHRYEGGQFYPGGPGGGAHKVGEGEGKGFNVNVPWSSGDMGDSEYLSSFYRVLLPIAAQFAPEIVLVSAGFDAARGDPLGDSALPWS